MPEYPIITTKSYDTTCRYEEGQEVYLVGSKFSTQPGSPNTYKPIAVVRRPPDQDNPELELLLVGSEWTIGAYQRHKVLTAISRGRERYPDGKIVVVPVEDWRIMQEHCVDLIEPAVRTDDAHVGRIYGMLIYATFATKEIQVF